MDYVSNHSTFQGLGIFHQIYPQVFCFYDILNPSSILKS
jgi:hypothetical protein